MNDVQGGKGELLIKEMRGSLSEYVFETIREKILEGEYKENDLLKENALATSFGVSRTPVREALKQLELEGLVKLVPNKGASVVGVSIDDIRDMYEMRALLEGLCAKKAVKNINNDDINKLEEIVELTDFYIAKGKMDAILDLDNQFHETIYQAVGSRMIRTTLSDFHHYVERMRKTTLNNKERAINSNNEHKAIVEAFKNNDSKAAEKLSKEHIRNTIINIEKNGLW